MTEPDRFDERLREILIHYGEVIDVMHEGVKWIGDDAETPPSADERLAWAWLIRPDLGAEIADFGSSDLTQAIRDYAARRYR